MAVAVAAETCISIFVSCDLDVVLADRIGFLDTSELGVDDETELVCSRLVYESVADRSVICLSIVGLNPKLDPCKSILSVLIKSKTFCIAADSLDCWIEDSLLFSRKCIIPRVGWGTSGAWRAKPTI